MEPLNEEEVFWDVYINHKALGAEFHAQISFVDFIDLKIKYDQRLQGKKENLCGRLYIAGMKLEDPSLSKEVLLSTLEEVETCLKMVDHSPSHIMKLAVNPSLYALVKSELLRHLDDKIKLMVTSCLSEIMRISAPKVPYNDDMMKEIFQLIEESFHRLDDTKQPSFDRRVRILETVAKVRSYVVMIDLKCDDLILRMFQ